jgi:hypothetical protein
MATTPKTPTESAVNHDVPLGLRRVCNNASLSEEDIATGERGRCLPANVRVTYAESSVL